MTRTLISPEEGTELQQLYNEHAVLTERAAAALVAKGMTSSEFLAADQTSGGAWHRIREIRGETGQHWMHS